MGKAIKRCDVERHLACRIGEVDFAFVLEQELHANIQNNSMGAEGQGRQLIVETER